MTQQRKDRINFGVDQNPSQTDVSPEIEETYLSELEAYMEHQAETSSPPALPYLVKDRSRARRRLYAKSVGRKQSKLLADMGVEPPVDIEPGRFHKQAALGTRTVSTNLRRNPLLSATERLTKQEKIATLEDRVEVDGEVSYAMQPSSQE